MQEHGVTVVIDLHETFLKGDGHVRVFTVRLHAEVGAKHLYVKVGDMHYKRPVRVFGHLEAGLSIHENAALRRVWVEPLGVNH